MSDVYLKRYEHIRHIPNLPFTYNQFKASMLYAKYNIVCHKQIYFMTYRFISGPRNRPRQQCAQRCACCVSHTSGTSTQLDFTLLQNKIGVLFLYSSCKYFCSNQRHCIVSLYITIIQISSSQKQSLLFNITDGRLRWFVEEGGVLHCCLFQALNN